MKLTVIAVGGPGPLLTDAIREYERRAARYWSIDFIEVRQSPAVKGNDQVVKEAESTRALKRVPPGSELFVLTRAGGDAWSSSRLARHLEEAVTRGRTDIAFVIGGALGLSNELIRLADRRMRLSTFTMPHDMARLVLAEQLYRAGTIVRREPYHKGAL